MESPRERRELDARIAVEFFGWANIGINQGKVDEPRTGRPPFHLHVNDVPRYTEEVGLAWDIVDKLEKTITLRQYSYNRTYATFGNWDNSDDVVEANGQYCTPLAICLAALHESSTS